MYNTYSEYTHLYGNSETKKRTATDYSDEGEEKKKK